MNTLGFEGHSLVERGLQVAHGMICRGAGSSQISSSTKQGPPKVSRICRRWASVAGIAKSKVVRTRKESDLNHALRTAKIQRVSFSNEAAILRCYSLDFCR